MNYCFNCGAKLIEEDQKFCIKCGTELKMGNDERENSADIKNKDLDSKEDLDEIFSYLKKKAHDYKKEQDSADDNLDTYFDDSDEDFDTYFDDTVYDLAYENYNDDEDELIYDPFQKTVISEGMFGKPAVSIEGNFVKEGMHGRPKYYIDGDIIREGNQFGRPAYRIDGNFIKEGMHGRPKYYIDGDVIREGNQFGRVIGRVRR